MLPVLNRNSWIPEVFGNFFDTDFMPRVSATAPAINVKETDKAYTVELAAPGLKKEDFEISIDNDGNLHIKMESKDEKKALEEMENSDNFRPNTSIKEKIFKKFRSLFD